MEGLSAAPETLAPGVMVPDKDRAVLVIAEDGELAVGLREHLERELVIVKDARPGEAAAAADSCRPWPWMLVGAVPRLPRQLAGRLRRPSLIAWYGPAPAPLPRHARSFSRFMDLVAEVHGSLVREVGGMRLAIGSGVDLPGGTHLRSSELQALVSTPAGFDLPASAFRAAEVALRRHRIPLRPGRDPESGLVVLRPGAS
ncbi:MAG TPA: hypothetical protein VEK76_07070 [Candidatus Binatia bacterium]|nr:hypothetical protein [Candidatus Binatia bacterium]